MKKARRRLTILLGVALIFGAGLAIQAATAVTPGLYEVTGNPSCEDLYLAPVVSGPDTDLLDLGPLLGFKYDANPTGDVSSTLTDNHPWVVTNGPQDPTNSVSIFNVVVEEGEGKEFDWSATLGIDAVIVKAQNANAYVYSPEAFGDSGLVAPGDRAVSHVEFCYDYEVDVSKDAVTSFTRTYEWDIAKDFDESYDGFIGDAAFLHDYLVTVNKTGFTDSDWAVAGTIEVANNTPFSATLTGVSDVVSTGIPATVNCGVGFPYTLPAGETLSCTYATPLPDGSDRINTATVTTTGDVGGGEATADVIFGDPTTEVNASVTVSDDIYGALGSASDDKTFEYTGEFQCSGDPDDYTNGIADQIEVVNTATIDQTGQFDDATVTLDCYAPVPSKDATTSYTRTYEWEITKDFDDAYDGFIGDPSFLHDYLVSVDQTITDSAFAVSGTITVANPNPNTAMTVSLADSVDGVPATLDCGGTLLIPAGGSATCDYSADLATKTDGTNTATATLNGINFDATADYAFGAPTTTAGFPTVNVSDSNGESWTASGDDSWAYSRPFQCSDNPADYTNGVADPIVNVNTATIDETGQSDDATVTLDCYAPVVTKDASASYDERHDWDVSKTVIDPVGAFYPGDEPSWTWTIDIIETVVDQNFAVSGSIYVTNPASSPGSITVALADVLDDGTPVTLACGGSLTVAPGATETCGYSAVPDDASATLNTATGTFNLIDFTATADVSFVKNVVNDDATVSDTEIGLSGVLVSGGDQFTDTDNGLCSSDRADYGADGTYTVDGITNTAILVDEEGTTHTSTATTAYVCEASFVDLYKTTNGQPADPTKDISFALYSGTTQLETVSTLNNGANLSFQTALTPGDTYTVCEYPVPAGYTFEISVDGGNVLTYAGPPGEANPTGEIQCFDFTAPEPATGPAVVTFEVNNRFPGGAPRTPGYWKNWSTCSGGNQAATAEKLGGVDEGVYLLDDLLPQTIGDLEITTCEDGVLILSAKDLAKEKNKSNDAAYTLARALLAARLNQDAGACTAFGYDFLSNYGFDGTFEQLLGAADQLLIDEKFDGTGDYLGPKNKKDKDTAAYALWLYGIIDDYNNGLICTGTPSH